MVTTTRLIIVCTEAVVAQMNATLNSIDPSSTGDVMVAQLVRTSDPSTIVGRWSSWPMPEEHKVAILAEFAKSGWSPLKGSEGTVLATTDTVPAWGTQRFWLFDGMTWHPDNVLSVLGLELAPVSDE